MFEYGLKTVLAIAPHTDDVEVGCGGLIAKLVARYRCRVICLALSAAEESVPAGFDRDVLRREAPAAGAVLGIDPSDYHVLQFRVRHFATARQEILDTFIRARKEWAPDLVLLPSSFDTHQDHSVVFTEGYRAFKNTRMLGYEVVWNCRSFEPSCIVRLSEADIALKIEACSQFKSQAGRPYASAEAIRALALASGLKVGAGYAESYEVIRWLLD